ncbi:MAG: hypothetical protein ABF334_07265, partial [Akkermansiaceae bacterium]
CPDSYRRRERPGDLNSPPNRSIKMPCAHFEFRVFLISCSPEQGALEPNFSFPLKIPASTCEQKRKRERVSYQ